MLHNTVATTPDYTVKFGSKMDTQVWFRGELQVTPDGFGKLHVPQSLVRALNTMLVEPGTQEPDHKAHVTVFTKREVEKVGPIRERGQQYEYRILGIRSVRPHGWLEVARVYMVVLSSPDLETLRESYGLTRKINGTHPFHITFSTRRVKTSAAKRAALRDIVQRLETKEPDPADNLDPEERDKRSWVRRNWKMVVAGLLTTAAGIAMLQQIGRIRKLRQANAIGKGVDLKPDLVNSTLDRQAIQRQVIQQHQAVRDLEAQRSARVQHAAETPALPTTTLLNDAMDAVQLPAVGGVMGAHVAPILTGPARAIPRALALGIGNLALRGGASAGLTLAADAIPRTSVGGTYDASLTPLAAGLLPFNAPLARAIYLGGIGATSAHDALDAAQGGDRVLDRAREVAGRWESPDGPGVVGRALETAKSPVSAANYLGYKLLAQPLLEGYRNSVPAPRYGSKEWPVQF